MNDNTETKFNDLPSSFSMDIQAAASFGFTIITNIT